MRLVSIFELRKSKATLSSSLFALIFLSACNPLQGSTSGSTIDAAFHPGAPATDPSRAQIWSFDTGTDSSYAFDSNKISLAGGACKLSGFGAGDSNSANFSAGNFVGISPYGTLTGSPSASGVKLGNQGSCNGTTTNCAEFDASWTPHWADVVGLWHLNETFGTSGNASVLDSSTRGNHATPTSVVFGVPGKLSTTGSFEGVGSLNVPDNNDFVFGTGDFTLSAWVKTTDSGTDVAIGKYDGVSAFWMGANNGQFMFSAPAAEFRSTALFNDGIYHHVLTTRLAGFISFYVDGVVVASGSYPGAITVNYELGVGWGTGWDSFNWIGSMDEVAIWKAGLTDPEVQAIYERQSAGIQSARGGYYTSRVIDASTSQTWKSFSWNPTLPFSKPLPDYASGAVQNESITSYSSLASSTLMTGIVGLWHFDEVNGSASVSDSSGSGNTGTVNGSASLGSPGRFNAAVNFDDVSNPRYIEMNSTLLPVADAARTVSVWFKPVDLNDASLVSYGSVSTLHMYEIDMYQGVPICHYVGGRVDGVAPLLGQWNQLVCSYDGTDLNLYQNGVKVGNQTVALDTTSGTSLYIGNGFMGPSALKGTIDEVAIWNRRLGDGLSGTPNEIQQLYQRGASRIKFQVRSCIAADCSNVADTWKGPTGTADSYFSELNNTSVQGTTPSGGMNPAAPTMALQNYSAPVSDQRYFQYRAIFESDSTTPTLMPELKSATAGNLDASSPSIIGKSGLNFTSLTTFTQTLGTQGCASTATYNLGIGAAYNTALWYWWDATANSGAGNWSIAFGTSAQSNPAPIISTHAPTLNAMGTGKAFFKAFLNSSGSTPCELDQLQLNAL